MGEGDFLKPSDVLFIGLGKSAVCYYRCLLPAVFMEADWVGAAGTPPDLQLVTGTVKGRTQLPKFDDYKVVVVQQPRGAKWLTWIKRLQSMGVKVVFEIDDYLHAIAKMSDHDYAKHFDKKRLSEIEICMRACDAMICSTEFIRKRYKKYNANAFVCENGIDPARYRLTLPERPTVNIGWAGATAHKNAVLPWIEGVAGVMVRYPETCFVSVGQPFAEPFKEHFGNRAISVPWTLVDSYPSALTLFDIALAPAGRGNFFKGKSDLRWLEAAALGIPIIADPFVYPHIEHGVTGFHAETPAVMADILEELVTNDELRLEVGAQAKEHVLATRGIDTMVQDWWMTLRQIVGEVETPVPA